MFRQSLAPILACLTLILSTQAHAETMVAESIEWRVYQAEAIVRATVATVDTQNGANGLIIETATLKPTETLKGTAAKALKYVAQLYSTRGWETFDRPSRWLRDDIELVVFINQGQVASVLRLDGKLSHGRGYRAFTTDMQLCDSKNSILAAVYGAMAFAESEQPLKSIQIDVPVGTEFWSEVYGGSAVYLVVPIDSRLEAHAKRWSALDSTALNDATLNHVMLKQQAPRILAEIEQAKHAAATPADKQ